MRKILHIELAALPKEGLTFFWTLYKPWSYIEVRKHFWVALSKYRGSVYALSSGVEEGGLGGSEPPSCDLMGEQPPNLVNFFGT